jgi:hypothetical protein
MALSKNSLVVVDLLLGSTPFEGSGKANCQAKICALAELAKLNKVTRIIALKKLDRADAVPPNAWYFFIRYQIYI